MRFASRWIPGKGEVWEPVDRRQRLYLPEGGLRHPRRNEVRVDTKGNALLRYDGGTWRGAIEAQY
jgi:hypothetical protein